jgi:trimeric autotransporter adhesin
VYTVVLTASNGICFDTWTTEIEVIPPMIVTPPNVFSPNGDNTNDFYFVDVQWGEFFEALILNRWGNEVTTLTHLNQGWDGKSNGKDLEEGVYFIKYTATDYNGGIIESHTPIQLVR